MTPLVAPSRFPTRPADAPPALADLGWPRARHSQEGQRLHQLAPPPPPPQLAWQQQQQQDAACAAAAAQRQQLEAEDAALQALQHQAGSLAHCSSERVLGTVGVRWERQLALAQRSSRAEAAKEAAAQEHIERWLKRSIDSEYGHAGVAHAALLAQQRALGGEPPAPLPRTHGPPPPPHLGAAVRHVLLRRQDAEQVMRKVLAEVAVRLLKDKQQRERQERAGGGSAARDERERRGSTGSRPDSRGR